MDVQAKQLKYEKALQYEIFVKEEYGFAREKLKNAKLIFDIGGHIGYFSKRCRTFNSHAEIHYFEPIDVFCDRAKKLMLSDKNFFLNNLGIASNTCKGTIFFNEEKTMQSSKYHSFLNLNGVQKDVNYICLSEYLEKYSILSIDVMKIDIEGMEFEVLFSWNKEWNIVHNMIIEIHLINNCFREYWKNLYKLLIHHFKFVEIIPSGYNSDIFLVWACE